MAGAMEGSSSLPWYWAMDIFVFRVALGVDYDFSSAPDP